MRKSSLSQGRVPAGMMLLVLVGLIAGCRTYNVRSDWDPAISFERLQRFYWQEPPVREDADPFEDNTLMRKRVRFSIETALSERGYRAVEEPSDADFFVTYDVVLDDRLRVDGVNSGFGGFGIGQRGRRGRFGLYGGGANQTSVREYQESVLLIDFLNPADETLVWRGWGTGIVQTRDRERGQDRLDDGVAKILAEFPPPYEDPR
ncbi:MAG: DUF4136 domain-containing protein [Myxococcota bacterium]